MKLLKSYKDLSIAKKMMVVLLPAIIIAFLVLSVLFDNGAVNTLEETSIRDLTKITDDFHEKALGFIDRTQDIMKTLKSQNATAEALQQGNPENAQRRLEAYKQEISFLESIGMVDAQGTLVADADRALGVRGRRRVLRLADAQRGFVRFGIAADRDPVFRRPPGDPHLQGTDPPGAGLSGREIEFAPPVSRSKVFGVHGLRTTFCVGNR